MQTARHSLATLMLLTMLAACLSAGLGKARSQPFVAPYAPLGVPLPSTAVPDCPGLARLLNSARLLQTVDLINVRRFYDAQGQDCVWSPRNAAQLSAVLAAAPDHGLDPMLFHAGQIEGLSGDTRPDALMLRDVLLTDAALRYARYVSEGVGPVAEANPDAPADRMTETDRVAALGASLEDGSPGPWLANLTPRYTAYVQLQAGLVRYREIAAAGGWAQVPETLARGRDQKRDHSGLRTRLFAEGDLAIDSGLAAFDDDLKAGLARFQWRNGMRADGALTRDTISRLNISVGERLASLALNLERLRRTLRDVPPTRVEVNIPAATAVLFRDGRRALRMNAVVGAPQHETPELSSAIDSIVLNPSWTIPRSIVVNEIEPHLKRDRKHLKKNHMFWQGDQLVQKPGPWNALGRVKFDFPNPYAVYLHDTPARALFTDPERAASHGCVRLERPVELAEALLAGDRDWDLAAIKAAIETGRTQRIRLGEPMPVVLTYQTAFAEADGSVHFRPDVYGRDTKLTLALSNRLDVPVPAPSP